MISALIYLRVTSLVNAYRAKLRRLKQPRYLFGAIAGVAYFYFFFFRRLFAVRHSVNSDPHVAFDFWTKAEPFAVVILMLYLLSSWIFASDRAELTFTESEIAFLFPAPVSRRGLIHFKLSSSQIRILVSAAFFALVRTRIAGGPFFFVIQLFGWWAILSCISLHRIGAAFTRQRLLDVGVNPVRRRLLVGALVLIVGGLSYFWARDRITELLQGNTDHPWELFNTFLNTPPLSWVLWPLRLVVAPMFTNTLPSFLRALGPALGVLALHYFWVIKSEVAFEEASIVASRKRADWIQAARTGKLLQSGPKKWRPEPFRLRPHGARPVAFLWRNLIGLGALAARKWWINGAFLLIIITRWLISRPAHDGLLIGFTIVMGITAGYGFLLSPVFVRRPSQRLIEEIDVIKAYPLRGWEIILGEMLAPLVLVSCLEWILFVAFTMIALHDLPRLNHLPIAVAIGAAQVVPFLEGILFSINFAGVLLLPAWTYQVSAKDQSGGGIDKMGQRLIFTAGYLLTAIVALIPAALIGLGVFGGFKLLLDETSLGAVFAGTAAALTLAGEFAAILWWLGERYETFDVSAELPR